MQIDELMGTVMRMLAQMEAVAVVGARATLASDGSTGDATVTPYRALLLQAAELLAAPGRAPGWVYDDPAILQSYGAASSEWASLVARIPEVAERIARPGARLLDIGTGVARLAIGACRAWPGLSVVGIDPWEPSLALARRNIADAGLADRIELRRLAIEELDEPGAFDVAWLPGPFLPPAALELACTRSLAALAPGGWAVLGLFGSPPDPVARALVELRVVRAGAVPLAPERGPSLLAAAGFVDVREVPPQLKGLMRLVIGRAP